MNNIAQSDPKFSIQLSVAHEKIMQHLLSKSNDEKKMFPNE